jgi:hypothetical protein
MEEKTKKKRVEKRAVRKKSKAPEPVVAIEAPVVPEIAPATPAKPKTPAVESKRPRQSSKRKSSVKLIKPTTDLPTYEQVQLRAYFISERRRKLGLPGDENHDWLAAEQELKAELKV